MALGMAGSIRRRALVVAHLAFAQQHDERASAAVAERILLASQRDLWRGTLVLMFVADEEIDGGGSRAAREAAAEARPDRDRRADQQCGLRGA